MAKTAEVVTVADLRPNADNPRSITDDKLKALKAALEEFGDLGAVVFNRKSGQLVGGHQRAKLFSKNSEIRITKRFDAPTRTGTVAEGYVILKGERFKYREVSWSLVKEKAANIAANKGAGEWDLPKLATWMQDLKESGFDLNLTMFDESERASMLTVDKEEPGCDEDDAPEPPKKPKTVLGDVYTLGRHRLMCGDSTSLDAVEKLMAGEKADMVFTDPPYNINYQGVKDKREKIKNDKMSDEEFLDFIRQAIAPSEVMYVCCSWQYAALFKRAMADIGRAAKAMIVWDKVHAAQHLDMYYKQHEIIFYHGPFGGRKTVRGDIWQIKRQQNTVHPTMKPIELIEMALEDHQDRRCVYDGFGGSGSTLIACEKTNRRCFMMELDPKYCDVIVTRWEKYSGKKAKLVNNEIKKQKRGK